MPFWIWATTTTTTTTTATATPTAPTTYNVRDYQNPDAGAADQPLTKAAKGKTKGKTKGTKGVALALVCFHCGKSGAKLRSCGQCHRAYYCDRECQRKDWPRHKPACRAAVAAEARRATQAREATAAARASGGRPANETCVVCVGPGSNPALPSSHETHRPR